MTRIIFTLLFLFSYTCLFSQQVADTSYHPTITNPMYLTGKGSAIYIDEGHYNLHKKNESYKPFTNLLEKDGYRVYEYEGKFKKRQLAKAKILVISNALNKKNVINWYNPTYSAFSKREIKTVNQWVNKGGSLFLIADHIPFGGAAKNLAASFGFEFTNGYIADTVAKNPDLFTLKDQSLFFSIITIGRDSAENVSQVKSFSGQGFKVPVDATPILIFGENYVTFLPDTASVINDSTTSFNAEGWSQGAYKQSGKGKIVVFGEAAMFSARFGSKENKIGMNHNLAEENFQLLLNIIHWLDGKLEE